MCYVQFKPMPPLISMSLSKSDKELKVMKNVLTFLSNNLLHDIGWRVLDQDLISTSFYI